MNSSSTIRVFRMTTVTGAILILALACGGDGAGDAPPLQESSPSTVPPPPTIYEIGSVVVEGIYDQPVQLNAGLYEGEPFEDGGASRPRVQLLEYHVTGELDGAPGDETAVFLAETSGGSGTFLYVAVMGRDADGIVNLATAPAGDRIQVRDAWIDDGIMSLEVVQAGPDDAMCCPGELATRIWQLADGDFQEAPSDIPTARLSLSDLEGAVWTLRRFGWREPYSDEAEITIAFDGSGFEGSLGCDRYFGTASEGEMPGDVTFGETGVTRMACETAPMEVEQRYLEAVSSVSKFGFMFGELILTYQTADSEVSALFFESGTRQGKSVEQ